MSNYIMAELNGRTIPKEDKIFGVAKLAKEAEAKVGRDNMINAVLGSLYTDDGKLVVLSSVIDVLKTLTPEEYADYAPIGGVPEFLEKVKEAAFGRYTPNGYIEAIATPGGTGAIRNTIMNYSKLGDYILTSDWFWSPYRTITDELGRKVETYQVFTEDGKFNLTAFENKITELLKKQDGLVILFNTPAHNPTGFTPSEDDWKAIIKIIKQAVRVPGKKITFFLDIAYIDFSGESPEKSREFFKHFSDLPENILTVVAYSMSKGFTMYGMRSGAMICITPNKDIAAEYKEVCMQSNRGTWSNGTRSAMTVLVKVFNDEALLKKVSEERKTFSDMLAKRGIVFMEEAKKAGLTTCPFSGGYFLSVPCPNSDAVNTELQKSNIFAVDIGKGIRVAISAITEKQCAVVPKAIADAIKAVNK